MSVVHTAKNVDPSTLDTALGGVGVIVRPSPGGGWDVEAPVTAAALTTAITANVVIDRDANAANLRTQAVTLLASLQAIIDLADVSFSNVAQAQTQMRTLQGQIRTLARGMRGLIRLATDDLDATT